VLIHFIDVLLTSHDSYLSTEVLTVCNNYQFINFLTDGYANSP